MPPPDREVGRTASRHEPLGPPELVRSTEWEQPGRHVESNQPTGLEADSQPVLERQGESGRGRGRRLAPAVESDHADADPASVARTIVLRKLAVQARTRHELAKALAARQVPEEVASDVLDRFTEVGLVDDATFAQDWVESRQQRRHLSSSALRRELQTKGVDRDLVDTALGQVASEDELSAAQALAEKKLRSVTGLPREVQYRRLAGALARRGFSGGITASVVGPLLDAHQAE